MSAEQIAAVLAGSHMTDDAEHEVYVSDAMAEHLTRKIASLLTETAVTWRVRPEEGEPDGAWLSRHGSEEWALKNAETHFSGRVIERQTTYVTGWTEVSDV